VSHHHSNKKEPQKTVKLHTETPETGPAAEPAAESAHAQAAESPAAPPAAKEKPAEEKKSALFETVAQLRTELEQAKDRALRCQAELDNYRKRACREMEDHVRYANIGLMRDLLPVLDNIQRAIEAAEKSTDGSGLLEGVKLVAQQLQGVLEQHHCVKIEALHAPFDPHLHHAILQQPADEHPANTIIMVTQDGYQLHDRVVRPSQVIVSTNSTE
jgi:molecular chaperone GrpE